jgi:hypothetical protein
VEFAHSIMMATLFAKEIRLGGGDFSRGRSLPLLAARHG